MDSSLRSGDARFDNKGKGEQFQCQRRNRCNSAAVPARYADTYQPEPSARLERRVQQHEEPDQNMSYNFGRGTYNPGLVPAALMMLAFLIDRVGIAAA